MKNPQAFLDYRRQTTGSETIWRYGSLFQIRYTDGVRILAESCGAYWIIDLISSYRRLDFEVWDIDPHPEGGVVFKRHDGDYHYDVEQHVEFTDLPDQVVPLKLYCESGTIMLPEER